MTHIRMNRRQLDGDLIANKTIYLRLKRSDSLYKRSSPTEQRKNTMEDQQKKNSLLIKLKYDAGIAVNDALSDLLNVTTKLDDVTRVVLERIESGTYFVNEHVADLIVATRSQELYDKVKDRVLSDNWTAVKLYRGGIDCSAIEELLCERLYKIAYTDGEPLRVVIVEALGEVGSPATLPLLKSFLYDMTPGAKLHETFSESLTLLDLFKIRARSTFLKTVERTIEQIAERESHPAPSDREGKEEPVSEPDLGLSTNSIREKAEKCIAIGLPDIALFVVRRGAENIAKQAYRATNDDKDGRAARKMMLKKLLGSIKEGAIPERPLKLLHVFQTFGNMVAHPQEGEKSIISDDVARSMVVLYVYADEAFRDWLERRDGAR